MSTETETPPAPAPYRTPPALRRALTVVAAIVALLLVAWGAVSILQLATRHTTTEVDRYRDITALVIEDASDIRLTSAPAGAPLEVRARVTESLVTPERQARRGDNGTLRLSSSCSPGFFAEWCGVDYEIAVPAGTAIQARTSAGDIDAQDISTTLPVELHSSAGDITVIGALAPSLRLSTDAGDVRASGVRADEVIADSSAGDIDASLLGPAERLDVRTSAGDVDLVVPDTVYRVETTTSAGDIDTQTIRTSPTASRSIRAVTSAGDIRIESRR
jgi:DUF4097 and DUF4098 domain-containing protein YvlB